MWPDWRMLKAQYWQESRLDPDAVSPAGARGVAQFMRGTWSDVAARLGYPDASPHVADYAIPAGAYYMARLCAGWSTPRPIEDRQRLAQASYNAGMGSLLEAQRVCNAAARGGTRAGSDGAVLWAEIAPCLPAVTGRHAAETLTYVARIRRWWTMMMAGLR